MKECRVSFAPGEREEEGGKSERQIMEAVTGFDENGL
jgi:hypothetical protein